MAKSETQRERIANLVRDLIVTGELEPGARVAEEDIAARYKASRTPVREALRQLESEGFLTILAWRGAVVNPITAEDVEEFYEVKGLLEGYAAQKATSILGDEDIHRMQELNQELKRCYEGGDTDGMIHAHNEFHEVFFQACGNERLSGLIKSLVHQNQRFRIALSYTESIEQSLDVHDQIIDAFRKKDAEQAQALVMQNARDGCESLLKRLKYN
jgi:DNA-binding GntR family transcriptional regulator